VKQSRGWSARELEREGPRPDQLNDALEFELSVYGVKAA
jgi:hypothetical protein